MKKQFRLIDLDCAHCAAKLEAKIKKVNGVNEASVNFLTQKLVVEVNDDNAEAILDEVLKVCHKVKPDVKVVL